MINHSTDMPLVETSIRAPSTNMDYSFYISRAKCHAINYSIIKIKYYALNLPSSPALGNHQYLSDFVMLVLVNISFYNWEIDNIKLFST